MADFFKALFDGSGDLTTYTPDTGSALTAPAVDIDDGGGQAAMNSVLASTVLDGSGAAQLDKSIEPASYVYYQLPVALTTDYFIEITLRVSPNTQFFDVILAARASIMVTGAWPNGENVTGVEFTPNGADGITVGGFEASDGGTGTAGGADTPGDYPAGPYTITLRLEVNGALKTGLVDGAPIASFALTDPNFVSALDSFIAIRFDDTTANLTDIKLLSLRAGSLPESSGVFWSYFAKTHETDA